MLLRIHRLLIQLFLVNRQVILFVIIGFICYLIGLGLLMLFVEWVNLEVNLANIVASIITMFICYLLNVEFVFKEGRHSKGKEILAFYSFALLGFLINVGLMFVLTKFLLVWYVVAKTLVTMAVAVFNFIARKKFVFLD